MYSDIDLHGSKTNQHYQTKPAQPHNLQISIMQFLGEVYLVSKLVFHTAQTIFHGLMYFKTKYITITGNEIIICCVSILPVNCHDYLGRLLRNHFTWTRSGSSRNSDKRWSIDTLYKGDLLEKGQLIQNVNLSCVNICRNKDKND